MRGTARRCRTVLAVAVVALAVVGCEGDSERPEAGGGPAAAAATKEIERDPRNAAQTVVVGSKSFPEQALLGEIYSQAFEAAGYKVRRRPALRSEQAAFRALKDGDIDTYPEYTGTVLTGLYEQNFQDAPRDPAQAHAQARQRLARDDLGALPYTPFENSYRLGAPKQLAQRLGIRRTSDLQGKARELSVTGYPACEDRLDCALGIQRTYDLDFEEYVPSTQTYEALEQRDADLGFLFTTDPQLSTGRYTTFEDDKNFFPPYNVSLLMGEEDLTRLGPQARQVVERIQKPLTERMMSALNARVVMERRRPEDVARQYLETEGFVR